MADCVSLLLPTGGGALDVDELLEQWLGAGLLTGHQVSDIRAYEETITDTDDEVTVDGLLEEWRDAGLLTGHQITGITSHAAGQPTPADTDTGAPPPPPSEDTAPGDAIRNHGVEALGYVGAALAYIALRSLVDDVWRDLPALVRAVFNAAMAVGFHVGGQRLAAQENPSLQRVGSVLWALTAITAGFAVGALVEPMEALRGWPAGFLGSMLAGAVALALYRRRPVLPLQLTLWGASIGAALSLAEPMDSAWGLALIMLLLGGAWLLLARGGAVPPRESAEILGAATVMIGIIVVATAGDNELPGIILGLAIAAAFAWLAFREGIQRYLVIGALYLFVFVPMLIHLVFGEWIGGEFVLLVSGLGFIAAAVALARARDRLPDNEAGGEERDLDPVPTVGVGIFAAVIVLIVTFFATLEITLG